MKILGCTLVLMSISTNSLAGNNFIEFQQFEKVQQVSVAAGALYACSKDEALSWPKRNAVSALKSTHLRHPH
nr:hypothetical protein [uncultured Marinobacter sp.]